MLTETASLKKRPKDIGSVKRDGEAGFSLKRTHCKLNLKELQRCRERTGVLQTEKADQKHVCAKRQAFIGLST